MNNQKINTNGFFSKLENTNPFIKVAFEGFPKSGKTYTASILAIGLHKMIKSKKPIVVYDTERSFKALKGLFSESKIEVLTRESRSLADLNQTIKLCESGTADIIIIDSITHVWESYVEAYKAQKAKEKNKQSYSLQFQDWGVIKPKWKKEFSNPFVESKLHIIFTGRAGFEYEDTINEDTKKREIVKSGIKMRAETEQAYEPDMLVLMERVQDTLADNKKAYRLATILGDRTDSIDGKEFKNPTFKDFLPAINVYLDGTSKEKEINETKDVFPKDEYDNASTYRKIELEKIEGALIQVFPGQTKEERVLRVDLLEKVFDTRSWKEVEITSIDKLRQGNAVLNVFKQDLEKQRRLKAEEGLTLTQDEIHEILDTAKAIALETPETMFTEPVQ